jgi:hypothetical protein
MTKKITEEREVATFIKNYVQALLGNNAAVFIGAGFSQAAGFVNWKQLLAEIADEIGLNVDKETDLIAVAQFHNNKYESRNKINQKLINEFSEGATLTANHKILTKLPIHICWTTNYDKLLEQAFEQAGKRVELKATADKFTTDRHNRDVTIYKMHGDIDSPTNAVVTKDDYEKFHEERSSFITALKGQLVSKTFLWMGYSFNDPNVDYILSRIRREYDGNSKVHYAIFRKEKQEDYETEKDFLYAEVRQELRLADLLKRYKIKSLLIDEYSQITEILTAIQEKYDAEYKRKTIFISGSAADTEYGIFSKKEDAGNFLHLLSKRLVEEGYKIVSGFGLGVGGYVINGALEAIFDENSLRRFEEHLILRPFPQTQSGNTPLPELRRQYRKKMISLASTAIFLFGNKIEEGEVKPANGLHQEFEIACEHGLRIIPVGATGYVAQEIAEKVLGEPKLSKLNEQDMNTIAELNNKEIVNGEDLAEKIISLIKKVTK